MSSWLDLTKPYLFLAPMAGVADWSFREICYRFGAEIAVSHLVPVAGLIANPLRVLPEIEARHGANPFIAQLSGSRPEDFEAAARIVTENLPVAGIDINMGCPVAPIVSTGAGSALLRDPERAAAIVAAACAGTASPVSVKLRLGWDCVVAAKLAPLLEEAGAKALIVHGRTRAQHYKGATDLAGIAAVKRAVGIPVIGNGDVVSLHAAMRMLEATGVDGLMVGRGALGNPWLFAELQARIKGTGRSYGRSAMTGDVIREHLRLAFSDLGPRKAPLAMRKHLIAYSSGSPSSAALRRELETLRSPRDIEEWIIRLEAVLGMEAVASSPDHLAG